MLTVTPTGDVAPLRGCFYPEELHFAEPTRAVAKAITDMITECAVKTPLRYPCATPSATPAAALPLRFTLTLLMMMMN